MGPYCKFCDNRCFVYLPAGTPDHIQRAYGTATIIATCAGGQRFEKEKTGYCYSDLVTLRLEGRDSPAASMRQSPRDVTYG